MEVVHYHPTNPPNKQRLKYTKLRMGSMMEISQNIDFLNKLVRYQLQTKLAGSI
jgi:hypothetical protein